MNTHHPLYQALAGPLSRAWLTARRNGPSPATGSLRILNFHETPRNLHSVFNQLLKLLREDHGVLSPHNAEAVLKGEASEFNAQGKAPCLLSFDDGFRSNYFLAREVLEPLGLRALFFVCPGLIDLEPEVQRKSIARNIRLDISTADKAEFEQELMSWEEVKTLAAAGHVIGSHSWSHARLSELDRAELEAEVGEAARLLNTKLGRQPRWFAHPFGNVASVNSAALACVAAHHHFCRSGVRGLNTPRTPAVGLLSQTIDLSSPLHYQLAVAAGALDFRYRSARKELSAKASMPIR
jgi:peptidoglycan/xylan/chitin deacetylase (PgdA/CDA1 family)